MATESAPTTRSHALPAAGRKPRLRQLWQVPIFFLGTLSLATVCLARPIRTHANSREQQFEQSVQAVRALLSQPEASGEEIVSRAEGVLNQARAYPRRAGEAQFLLGSAYLRLVERTPAPEPRAQAVYHLELADKLGVPERDQHKLAYRLGKLLYEAQADPQRVIELLSQSVADAADDPAEGYALLTQAYLRLPEPDVKAALEANAQLLQLPTDNDELLAPARLMRGELLLRLEKPAEAREALKRLKPPAAPELVARAMYLRAESHQQQGQWAEAAALWEEALQQGAGLENRPTTLSAARLNYFLGVCYQHLERPRDAERTWEQALPGAGDEEGSALALGLADLRLLGNNPLSALESFERAVRAVKTPEDWRNPLINLDHARQLFERGCLIYRETGRYDQSIQLAHVYQKLALPGMAQNLLAQAAEAAARVKQDDAKGGKPDEASRGKTEAAQALFRRAAAAYEASADAAGNPADRAERLWLSGESYRNGKDPARALAVLDRFLKQQPTPEHLGEAWFCIAEAHRALNHSEDALAAYENALKSRGPYEYEARYQQAKAYMARGKWDRAKDILERNLHLLRQNPVESEAHEKTLLELGNLLYQRANYSEASEHLKELLESYKASSNAIKARYQLAECYRQLAEREKQNLGLDGMKGSSFLLHVQTQYRTWLKLAAEEYQRLEADLAARHVTSPLSRADEAYLTYASFTEAHCLSNLGDYDEARRLAELLALRYHHRVESLIALRLVRECQFRAGRSKEAQETLERMRTALAGMNDDAFDKQPPEALNRPGWEAWLKTENERDLRAEALNAREGALAAPPVTSGYHQTDKARTP